jgi:hypothetical protein
MTYVLIFAQKKGEDGATKPVFKSRFLTGLRPVRNDIGDMASRVFGMTSDMALCQFGMTSPMRIRSSHRAHCSLPIARCSKGK